MIGTRRAPRRAGQCADFLETLAVTLVNGAMAGVGFVLAALLFTWATAVFAAEADAGSAAGGALMLRAADGGSTVAAPRVGTDVTVRVTGMIARVHIAQRFHNPDEAWCEGVYVFPLPPEAAVDTLRMRIGARVVEGVIKEREAARRKYAQARAAGARAALLEQERPNVFTSSVANIGPHETVRVEIEYQQRVAYADGQFGLRLPLVVAPRYIPGQPASEPRSGSGWAADTDRVPDAARITPPVAVPDAVPGTATSTVDPVHIAVELDVGLPLATITSASHRLRIERGDGTRYRVALADEAVAADRDFVLAWAPAAGNAPRAAFFRESHDGADYGLLMVMPPQGDALRHRMPREVIFIIDTSGSMDGVSIRQAREALALALRRLTPADRFNVIAFNDTARAFAADALTADATNIARAVRWVRALRADGGTEMGPALNLAFAHRADPRVLRQIVFLTDGEVGNEEELFALIARRLGDSRLFTVGIGSAPNSHFMAKAAELGRGTYTYIDRVEDVATRMHALYARLESPAMRDLQVLWPQTVEAWPQRIPDLYQGEPVLITVRAAQLAGPIVVRGRQGDIGWSQQVPLQQVQAGAGVHKLWARAKIDALGDGARNGVAPEQVRAAIVEVALAHGLVSRYTSLVAVETTPVRPQGAPLHSAAVPVQLPAGWKFGSVFGSLPQTATAAALHTLYGAAAFAFALLLIGIGALRRRRHA